MSVGVLLIPLGIAAVAALKEGLDKGDCDDCDATRITDVGLLVDTLERLGAQITERSEDRVTATAAIGDLTFVRAGEIFLGRVDGADAAATAAMLRDVDTTVGRIVQARTAERALARAGELGFRLISQSESDGTVNFVFEEV